MMLDTPFPWFGGKRKAAGLVWARFGSVRNYIEPFFGGGAVLLRRPPPWGVETVNDIDSYIANFWRAIQHDPEQTAHWAAQPVNEADLSARHLWLLDYKPIKVQSDPDYYDAKIAGWWVWGICCWIGRGWCSGEGPWVASEDGFDWIRGKGVNRQLPHLGTAGHGVNRKRPHLGDAGKVGPILDWFCDLASRLERVRVCCGDFERVLGPSPTTHIAKPTAVFLDPPYSHDLRDALYTHDAEDVAARAHSWSVAHGDDPNYRIAYCGHEGTFEFPPEWKPVEWVQGLGYAKTGHNRRLERIWFSPHCLPGG